MDTALIDTVQSASPLVLIMLLCNGLGLVLKLFKVNHFWIPITLIPAGAFGTIALFPHKDMPFEAPLPWAYKLIIGTILGCAAVGIHTAITKVGNKTKPLEEQIAKLQTEIGELRVAQVKKAEKAGAMTPPSS